ncbi:MAG: TIGR03085 family metal-binding protein [Ilumatobacteraceae bacterium]
MTSVTAAERAALCDTLLEVGPEASTLCGDWTARDLAAHLVVRERRPDAGPGIVTSFLSGYSEHVRQAEAQRPFAEIVKRIRRGPPRWNPMRVDAVDRLVNSIEYFVHHEDLRRAARPFSVRSLDPGFEDALADSIRRAGRFLARGLPVGLVLEPAGREPIVVRAAEDRVTVAGPVGECVLFAYGRQAVAQVTVRGPAAAITTVREASLGI